MWTLLLTLGPLIVLPSAWLIRRKMYRDTAVFAAISLAGLVLWAGIASGRPFILNEAIYRIFTAILPWLIR